jgi:uncharacterized protein (TIGR02145 family)
MRFVTRLVLLTAAALLGLSGCGENGGILLSWVGGNNTDKSHTHIWGNWTVTILATCDAAGAETRTCTQDASHKETRAIARLTGAACNSGGGGSYESVVIGGKRWMKKNLDIKTADSWCYGEDGVVSVDDNRENIYRTLSSSEIQSNCNKSGRLYTWEAAKKACLSIGWRLPSRADWDHLAQSVGGTKGGYDDKHEDYSIWYDAGKKLKSTYGWVNNIDGDSHNGTDNFGFSALPGGYRITDGHFWGILRRAFWWTASGYADVCYVRDDHDAFRCEGDDDIDGIGFSVRCVLDN